MKTKTNGEEPPSTRVKEAQTRQVDAGTPPAKAQQQQQRQERRRKVNKQAAAATCRKLEKSRVSVMAERRQIEAARRW